MDEIRPPIVEVTGALSGRYELQEHSEDGSAVIGPDTSLPAIMHRLASEPASPEEFKATLGDLPTTVG